MVTWNQGINASTVFVISVNMFSEEYNVLLIKSPICSGKIETTVHIMAKKTPVLTNIFLNCSPI